MKRIAWHPYLSKVYTWKGPAALLSPVPIAVHESSSLGLLAASEGSWTWTPSWCWSVCFLGRSNVLQRAHVLRGTCYPTTPGTIVFWFCSPEQPPTPCPPPSPSIPPKGQVPAGALAPSGLSLRKSSLHLWISHIHEKQLFYSFRQLDICGIMKGGNGLSLGRHRLQVYRRSGVESFFWILIGYNTDEKMH